MSLHVCCQSIDIRIRVCATGAAAASDLMPEDTNRFAGVVSLAFQGGTFERLQQMCSGDFCTVEQNKYIATLPGLSEKVRHMLLMPSCNFT